MKLRFDFKDIDFQKSTNDHLKFSSKIEYNYGNLGEEELGRGDGVICPKLWRDKVMFWVNLVKVSQKSFFFECFQENFKKRIIFLAKG